MWDYYDEPRSLAIEAWCVSIAERVVSGTPVEDDRVELKCAWIEPVKAAQRIAAHANAATPESAIWIIGLDEKAQRAPGAPMEEFGSWWDRVAARFDGKAPSCRVLAVPFNGVILVAIMFNTSEAPFVVKNPISHQLEVPWREGTRTRTARRQDLIRVLAPRIRKYKLACDQAFLRVRRSQDQLKCEFSMGLLVILYDNTTRTFLPRDIKCVINVEGSEAKAEPGLSFWTLDQVAEGDREPSQRLLTLNTSSVVTLHFADADLAYAGAMGVTAQALLRIKTADASVPMTIAIPLRMTTDLGNEAGFTLAQEVHETD